MGLEVGQKLWWVPSHHPKLACEVTVIKLGRKWATLNNQYRIDMATLCADGGQFSSPGRCYLSQKRHEEEVVRDQAWAEFREDISHRYRVPSHLTIEDIADLKKKVIG